ncbi:MAG: phosphoglycolate phosphatase [Pseudorhodoplanes sp.]|nr:Phosphoglycolate phosphatase [Pseudorhodoplanes sp.]MBW7948786.1 phosphoglycolate phosphatase [Pseudorhodoplanes sp.]MCL4713154.1 phosphoglycolate phosphatase [Pseudorhodoplanes sp.]MCQ3942542.1 phosphoglycolate phosphatase [Alphaproteobacteria bacterium]GIK81775.1 MAG: phosphoglycolate phosphatase, bacterial [Alphaproteobacteria bacterium]
MSSPLAIFDLDGTLIDTAPDLVETLNIVLAAEDFAPVTLEDARVMIGGGARAMIARALERQRADVPQARRERMFDAFMHRYAAHIADYSRPFPGLTDALDRLTQDGFRLAICTNKLEWLSRRLLDTLGLSERFAVICGQDTFGVKKPDPAVLHATIAAAGASCERALMVGDSDTDIRAARAAGIPVIAVDFGYTETPVSELGPDLVISHFDALHEAVQKIERKRAR